MTHDYPTLSEVIAIHATLIAESGGDSGIRDEAALASALMRPQIGYYEGLVQESAAMMESLANNHPFVDGNKRVAFVVTDTFLRMNGHFIECESKVAYEYFMQLFETGSFHFAALERWLSKNIKALPCLHYK
ncbi:MAG: type II toxin-antitoxin system death-on-curing family toxin [Chloroflexota bacterium]|nr:type II toxin-antitoxin system death-on-curing family toxin [Chloroflexota bacterium]MDE2839120.1 type II toxin-antitoxin system death-on-curing family toxin [Chloroflexota bacterium]MDE2931773.1 type II toxin-antitoxin system death-on-curing family toxin [Chloroflexota bacterium]